MLCYREILIPSYIQLLYLFSCFFRASGLMECLGSLIQAVLRADCGDLMKHERLDFYLGCTYPDSCLEILEAASLRKAPSFALRT